MDITPTAARLLDFEHLSVRQLSEVITSAKSVLQKRQIETEAERRTSQKTCPHCQGQNISRWGMTRGLQRWRCGDCKKTFTGLTKTEFHYTKKRGLIFALVQDMMSHSPSSCREAAEIFDVHHMTIWRWRMKILKALIEYKKDGFEGIIEADETFVRESRKGSREWVNFHRGLSDEPPRMQWYRYGPTGTPMLRGLSRWQRPVLVLRDRGGHTLAQQLPGVSYKHIAPVLEEHIPDDGILCSDSAPAYKKFARVSGIRLEQMNVREGQRVKDQNFHIQNANSLHHRFKFFMRKWKGPATKNLQKYVGWMIFRDTHKFNKKAKLELLRYALEST